MGDICAYVRISLGRQLLRCVHVKEKKNIFDGTGFFIEFGVCWTSGQLNYAKFCKNCKQQ